MTPPPPPHIIYRMTPPHNLHNDPPPHITYIMTPPHNTHTRPPLRTGCRLITDQGLEWFCKTFASVKEVTHWSCILIKIIFINAEHGTFLLYDAHISPFNHSLNNILNFTLMCTLKCTLNSTLNLVSIHSNY